MTYRAVAWWKLASVTSLVFAATSSVAGNKSHDIETAGTALAIAIPLYAFADLYYDADREGLVECGKETVVTAIATEALKHVVPARRPNGGSHAFPSGHVTFAMSGASCVGLREGLSDAWWLYAGTALVGYSRVDADKHTTAQVLGSGLLSYLISMYFVEPRSGNTGLKVMVGDNFEDALSSSESASQQGFALGPIFAPRTAGIGLSYSF